MGASEWDYFVPYQEDVGQALTELQRRVLAERDFYTHGDAGDIESMADLAAAKQAEEFWEEGTHSILDIDELIGADQADDVGAIRPLRPDEMRALLGTDTPTRSDFERFWKSDSATDFPRWSGRYAVVYQDGRTHEIAFWGYSGD